MKAPLNMEIHFDEINFEDIPEIEEVITPNLLGSVACCVNGYS